jgi:protease PrsW
MTNAAPSPERPGIGRRLLWLWILLAGVVSYLLVLRTLVATQNPNFVPSLILLGSVVVPATVLTFAASTRGPVLVSPGTVAATAIAGGIIGTVAAGTLEYDVLHGLGALPMILVGFIEEAAKLIVPLIVLAFSAHRTGQAGVIVGVASGMGFATLETMGYGFSALLAGGNLAAVDDTLLLRALLSPAGHVAWTGLTAAALWSIPGARRKGLAVLRAVGVFLAAVLLHAAWDGFPSLWMHLIVGGISLTALLLTIHWAHRNPDPLSLDTRQGAPVAVGPGAPQRY